MITQKIATGSLTAALAVGLAAGPATAHNGNRGGWQGTQNEGGTALMLTKGVKQGLRAEGVGVAALDPAKQWNRCLFTFPAVRSDDTTITHTGGLSLTKGDNSVVVSDFVVNTDDGTVDATVDGAPVNDVFTLDRMRTGGKWFKADVRLGAGKADALDAALGTTVFEDGMFLGKAATWFGWKKNWQHGDRGWNKWGEANRGWQSWSDNSWSGKNRDDSDDESGDENHDWSGRGSDRD